VPSEARVAVEPASGPSWIRDAVVDGGGRLVAPEESAALVWCHPQDPQGLVAAMRSAPDARWVQLPWAGIEPYVGVLDHDRTWTCGKGVYAEPVAEHAVALALAGLRGLHERVIATAWGSAGGLSLFDQRVTVVGGGGITEELLRHLAVYRCRVTVVRRHVAPMAGAETVVGPEKLHDALRGAQVVFLALALTAETEGIIGADQLACLEPTAWLVNVARGAHVDTAALIDVLQRRAIGGAALDVTEPEPLPEGHPLWTVPNCIITPHTANTPEMARPLLARRISDNVRRFIADEPLLGLVDTHLGY
jgi:phosphoglycerate dehydrogenase-like enzyme